jgi:hydroxylamine dehydrogenase
MCRGIKFIISVMILTMFVCIQLGCEQASVRNTTVAAEQKPIAVEERDVKQEASPSESKKEEKACCTVKKDETSYHPKDKRTIQQIISQLTGEKIGPDDSGDLYHSGLTATYTGPEELLPGEGKFGKLFHFLPVIRWYDPDHYYTPNMAISGEFKHEECIMCHTIQTQCSSVSQ